MRYKSSFASTKSSDTLQWQQDATRHTGTSIYNHTRAFLALAPRGWAKSDRLKTRQWKKVSPAHSSVVDIWLLRYCVRQVKPHAVLFTHNAAITKTLSSQVHGPPPPSKLWFSELKQPGWVQLENVAVGRTWRHLDRSGRSVDALQVQISSPFL